jgi:pimeloyl-ACP methyl ester carboxylesterase
VTAPIISAAPQTITLGERTIRYHDIGAGPVLVFVHGILVNSALWRQVIAELAPHFRCIAPDLPLGAHSIAMPPSVDQSPLGVAHLIADFIAALDLEDVTLVGNDTGGALCQLVITRHPARITRLVLTNCDAFEAFFPAVFSFFSIAPRILGQRFTDGVAWLLRYRLAQRLLYATVARRRFSAAELDANFTPLLTNAGIRRDVTRFLAQVTNRLTLDAAKQFANFSHPVLLVWAKHDLLFTRGLARRLEAAFPNATLEYVTHSRAFVPEDQPELLAKHITAFVKESAPQTAEA